MMTDANALTEARKKAEQAVADMPDGELKLKAFELILSHLLSGAERVGVPGRQDRSKRIRNDNGRLESKSRGGTKAGAVSGSAPARILELKTEGFFDENRGIGEIRDDLQTHGWMYDVTALSGPLMKLVRAGELRRKKIQDGNKTVFKYYKP